MNFQKDPIGIACLDYLSHKNDENIIVHSNLCEDDVIPVNYLFRDFEAMPELEQIALELANGKILDVGAGSGCHSLWLQNKGLNCTAIDISKGAVECMKKRGINSPRLVDFYTLKNEKYDTILMLMNGIGISGNLANLNNLLQQIKNCLTPKGQCLLDSSDIIYLFDKNETICRTANNYYGVMQYQMEYKLQLTDWFNWLYLDIEMLKKYASKNGLVFDIISQSANYSYLTRLTLKKNVK